MRRHYWLKRILVVALALILSAIGGAMYAVHLAHARPSWYRKSASASQANEAANRADQKFTELFNWAAQLQAQMMRTKLGRKSDNDSPPGPITITFGADELNAFAKSWVGKTPATQNFSDIQLAVDDGQIILAAQSTDFDALVSAAFTPSIDSNGQFSLQYSSTMLGTLPVPRTVIQGQLDHLKQALQTRLTEYQSSAEIDATFAANSEAARAWLCNVMLCSLNDRPSPAVLMVPFSLQESRKLLPVRLSAISAKDDSISMTLAPMTPDQQQSALSQIKAGPQ